MSLADDITYKALELGFDLAGITDAAPIDTEQVEFLTAWLKSGFAGQMDYMHRNFEKRINPAKLLENAQSVIVVGLNYKPPKRAPSIAALQSQAEESTGKRFHSSLRVRHRRTRQSRLTHATVPTGKVASYAQYEDYHGFMKKQLRELVGFIGSIAGTGCEFRICVDSAPLAERALAARAGLGFIGKNHMLISPRLGPEIFLAEIVTTLKLQLDKPLGTECSNCSKCIDACPTGALRPDGQFDANKCISYLTIEYKGQIRRDLTGTIGNCLFGCDECVLVCPYQQNAPPCKNTEFKFYNDRARLDLNWILNMTHEDFGAEFADSAIKRLGLGRLRRNAQICLANITVTPHDSSTE